MNGPLQHLSEKFARLEGRLTSYENTLTKVFAHLPEGVLFITKEGEVILFNKAAEALLQIEAPEILGTCYEGFFTDRLFGFSLKKMLAEPSGERRVFLSLDNGEKVYALEVHAQRLEEGVLLSLRDRKKGSVAEKALKNTRRFKEIESMGARLAHEIRNPLGGIEGFATLLARDLRDHPSQKAMIDSILEGTRLLNRLVSQVLDYARPLQVHLSTHDLCHIVRETIKLVMADIDFQPATPTFMATVDKELLQMALLNLLKNALEATSGGEKVKVLLAREKQKIVLSIVDYGKGIPPEDVERLFTPFFTTKVKGTGLGLSEVDKVIKAHGGSVEVKSLKNPTIFKVSFYG